MDLPETPELPPQERWAATFLRPGPATPQGGLHSLLAGGPKDFGGLLAEYLGGTAMIFADCGDRTYEWLPVHEVAGSDHEDGALVSRLRFPELGCLLCAGLDVAVLVVAGCKERRYAPDKRPRAERAMFGKMVRFLQQFRALWAQSRRLRLRRTESAEREEAALGDE